MSEVFQAEFTGERVIPGQVEDNLFNEHLARYRFAARLARGLAPGAMILDAGCGTGYGSVELAKGGAQVLGIDVSEDAIAHARASYGQGGTRFEQASCTAIPSQDGAFHLITAFEVIEHLADWRGFLNEAHRVLHPGGLFLVSTPNRLYYAESRQKAGPNPFHVHEFTEDEFRAELVSVFPHVKILLQNHVEGIAFSGVETEGEAFEIGGGAPDAAASHFFLAVCGTEPLPPVARFVFIPETGNVLQTREHHIALLDGEILQKNQWIEQEKLARARMIEKVATLESELEQHNRWAKQANEEADRRAQLVAELQNELNSSNLWAQVRNLEAEERGRRIVQLQDELESSQKWAESRDAEAVERGERVVELQKEVAEATAWALAQEEDQARSAAWIKSLDAQLTERGERIVQLQDELAREQENSLGAIGALQADMASAASGYEAAIDRWRQEKEASDQWAMDTERRLSAERDAAREAFAGKQMEYENALQRLAALQAEAEQLRAELTVADARMDMIAQSRWVRLGRTIRIGPEIPHA